MVNTEELLTAEKVTMPGNGGVMATVPGDPNHLLVADAFQPQIYWVNLATRTVERTIKAIGDISAIKVTLDAHAQPEIWVASRTENKVTMLNLATDKPVVTLDVGKKPVAFVQDGENLFVLSAGDSRLDVIAWPTRTLLEPIALAEGSFPVSMASVPSERKAYITMAGNTEMAIVDLAAKQVENTLMVDFRASMITTTPDLKAEAEQALVLAKQITPQPLQAQAPNSQNNQTAIGPEAPTEKDKKQRKNKKEKKSVTPVETVDADSQNAPKVMPALRGQGNSYNSSLNNGFNSGYNPNSRSLNQVSPLNIPLSRAKSKKHENTGDSIGPEAPPMLDESISK
jgi:hypothetical protein